MDDLKFGTRNKRGDFTPKDPLETNPLFTWPLDPMALLRWLPGYFLPWNLLFFGLGAVLWFWLTPAKSTMQTYEWGWALWIWARNTVMVFALYGVMELRLYRRRAQSNRFKYNAKFPADAPSDVFWFKSQNLDNILRSFGTGLPIWSAYEVFLLHAWANGSGPWTTFEAHPWALAVFALLLPLIHEVHFYCIHRLIHMPILYKWIHSVHHNSVNPSPWSSLSMHPVEHLLYWSDSLIHLLIPSHPLLVLYHLNITGTGAVVGHIGFDKIETGADTAIDSHAFAHYLHHKYFEVNYADGGVPLDRWFGTWHDGTKGGDAVMQARFEQKKARMNAGKTGDTK
ncbi:sterol desaturase family protein [Cypionkella sp.]|uniref:sterol desaturase family protein n=1 Tax=Cypionkella sp. TaxID=2811411 RepID=UPI000BD97194|nr:sterol desaturase family protein [Cypionkella sp.]MDO8986027.1 sterol desaturase family protein [Cypionkella sp.]MDP2050341.1 sterol desaturase family protein [Cypionkella sp.]OZA09153.1 MAG: desaturase [Rhodobacterales bacterium 17-64-5]